MMNANLINGYVNGMKEALDNNYWSYTVPVLRDIAEISVEAKADLYNLFSKHPLWNPEKGMIQFSADFHRPFSVDAIRAFLFFISRDAYRIIPEEKWDKIYNYLWKIDSQYIKDCSEKNLAEMLNSINESYRIRPEMRASKVIGKIMRTEHLDQIEFYNKRFSSMADDINALTIKRHTVISLNPVDFLLMSNGDTWLSCHNIQNANDDPGCYCAGTISYMLDSNSFLFYTVDPEKDETQIEMEEKSNRQVFAYKEGVLFQSRMYPQSCDYGAEDMYKETREVVQNIISECEGFNNLWFTSKSDVTDVVSLGEGAQCYPDFKPGVPGSSHCRISRQKEKETSHVKIRLGAAPRCIECGSVHDNHDTINCCNGRCYCEDCGNSVREEDAIYVDGYYYCSNCADSCSECGEYFRKRDLTETYDGSMVCEECLHYYYYYCDDIEDYVKEDDAICTDEGTFYYDNKNKTWAQCIECGEYHGIDDMCLHNNLYYCQDCYGDIINNEEDEENEDETA